MAVEMGCDRKMMGNNEGAGRIESVGWVPPAEEMAALLPESLPEGWEELKRHVGPGSALAVFGHRSPAPEYISVNPADSAILAGSMWQYPLALELPALDRSAYDHLAAVWVAYVKDEDLPLLEEGGARAKADVDLQEASALLEQGLASGEISEEDAAGLRRLMQDVEKISELFQEGTFLGRKARCIPDESGNEHVVSVTVGRYVVSGGMLDSYQRLPAGDTPMHSMRCLKARMVHQEWNTEVSGMPDPTRIENEQFRVSKSAKFVMLGANGNVSVYAPGDPCPPCECECCTYHSASECSTWAREGLAHREQIHSILEALFTRIEAAPVR